MREWWKDFIDEIICYLFVLFSSFSSRISIVGVEYEFICLVLLAGVAGALCSPWFWRNEKFAWNFFDSLLFLFRTLDFLSKKGTFPLCAIKNCFDFKRYKLTLLCSNGWNLLINTRINLDEIILICKLFCCSILPCSLNEFLGAIWAKCRHDCPKILSFWKLIFFHIWKIWIEIFNFLYKRPYLCYTQFAVLWNNDVFYFSSS